ncbi:MAG: hypothetical protein KF694_22760 [Mesorhizobium sp.]|nr:hypothetical protein [Mesorhizobium sp.]
MPLPGTPLPSAAPQRSPTFDRATGTIDSLREPVAHPDGVYGGNLDQMFVPAKGFTGMTLRLYDPATGLWSIYWSDTISHLPSAMAPGVRRSESQIVGFPSAMRTAPHSRPPSAASRAGAGCSSATMSRAGCR